MFDKCEKTGIRNPQIPEYRTQNIVSKRVESTGAASQCNDYIGNPIAHDIQQKKSDERGAASFYNLARVGVGEDQIRPETDHEHGWSKNVQIQKHLPPLADFTLEEITVKHFVEMRRGKTERGERARSKLP